MNRKQRVMAVLSNQPTDKIPLGEYAIDFDTVETILGHETYLRAKAKSQLAFWEGRRDEVVESWKKDTVELYRKLDCFDIINLGCETAGVCHPCGYVPQDPPKKIAENTWKDSTGRIYKYSDITADITLVEDPTMWDTEYNAEDFLVETQEKPDDSVFEVMDYIIEQLGDEYFLIGPSGGEAGMVLLGAFERGLTEYLISPEAVKAAINKETAESNRRDFFYIKPKLDGIIWGQDFAYNSGPFLNPNLFREFCLPSIKERAANVKNHFGKYVIKHACGNNWALMDMFIEAGYDCYQSLQASATMDIRELKHRYGDKICLWGGLPVEHLVGGTTEDIRADVQYLAKHAFPNGRYIFGSSHSVAVGTKYDNFMAMLDEFEKVRGNL